MNTKLISSSTAIDLFLDFLRQTQRSENTIISYHSDLKKYFRYIESHQHRFLHINQSVFIDFQRFLQDQSTDCMNTIRRVIIAIRRFYSFLEANQYIAENQIQYLKVPDRNEELPFLLTDHQIERLLAQIVGSSLKSLRDKALIWLLATSGINVTELCHLKWVDYTLKDDSHAFLVVSGSRQRSIPLANDCVWAINAYRNNIPDAFSYPHLMLSFRGNRDEEIMPNISRHGVKHIINYLGQKTGIPQLTPQLFRHYSAITWIEQGVDIYQVAEYLGLRSITTTDKYFAMLGVDVQPNSSEFDT